jgi:Cys-tRNA(Pro) deacylase
MAKEKIPSTQALRFLKSKKVAFKPYFYKYVDYGGTSESAKQLGIDEHRIIKTLIFEDANQKPFVVLMNGDYEVSIKQLARAIGSKKAQLTNPQKAQKYTGYKVGGTSPFGTRLDMKIFAQKDIFDFEEIIINGGQRGFLIGISTEDLKNLLNPNIIDVSIKS